MFSHAVFFKYFFKFLPYSSLPAAALPLIYLRRYNNRAAIFIFQASCGAQRIA